MKFSRHNRVFLLSVALTALSARADVLFDNSSQTVTGAQDMPASYGFVANAFISGSSAAKLDSITLSIGNFGGSGAYTPIAGDTYLKIYSGSSSAVGAFLGTMNTAQLPTGQTTFASSTDIILAPNSNYWIMVGTSAPLSKYAYAMTSSTANLGEGDMLSLAARTSDNGATFGTVSGNGGLILQAKILATPIPEAGSYAWIAGILSLAFVFSHRHRSPRT